MNKVIDQAIELKEQVVQRITNELQTVRNELKRLKDLEQSLLVKYRELPGVIENFANYRVYKTNILAQIEKIKLDIGQLEEQEVKTKTTLVSANIEKEKFVKFKNKQLIKKQKIEDKRQQKQFDEFASNAYVRKTKEINSP